MFPNLNAEMGRRKMSMKALAAKAGIGYESFKNKMAETTEFKRSEMVAIKNEFPGCSLDYLFATQEKEEQQPTANREEKAAG